MGTGISLLIRLACVGFQGIEVDYATFPPNLPNKEWVAEAVRGMRRGEATEKEIESIVRLFETSDVENFRTKSMKAADVAWQADCDLIAEEVFKRRASVPEVFWFQTFAGRCFDARACTEQLRRWMKLETRTLSGVVRNEETGEPIAGARVDGIWPEFGVTEGDGRFSVAVKSDQAGHYWLKVAADGRAYRRSRVTQFKENGTAQNLRVALPPESSWRGKLVDSQNRPVENTGIYASARRPGGGTVHFLATTDQSGIFRFRGLAQTDTLGHLCARGAGVEFYDPFGVRIREIPPNEEPQVFRTKPQVALTGTVVDCRGLPVALANVSLLCLDSPTHCAEWTWTDFRGRFALATVHKGKGRLNLVAQKANLARGYVEIDVGLGSRSDLKIELPDGDFVEGIALGPDGQPVAGCFVGGAQRETACGPWRVPVLNVDPLQCLQYTVTDEFGRFLAGPFPRGEKLRLTSFASDQNLFGANLVEAGEKDIKVQLVPPAGR